MIGGIGIDTIEIARMERELTQNRDGMVTLFTSGEIAYCNGKRHSAMYYAARFAAKEAFLKALGTGWREGIAFGDIEVTRDDLGQPSLTLHRRAAAQLEARGMTRAHVSLTHIAEVAAAIVIIER